MVINESLLVDEEETYIKETLYGVLVPTLISASGVTFLMNVYILMAFPLIRNLSRVRKLGFCDDLQIERVLL